jgi:hypothetical protein
VLFRSAGGIVAANVLKSSPQAQKAVLNTPSALANFGSNIGSAIESPNKIEAIKKVAKDNPVLTAGAGLLAAGSVGAAVSGVVSTALNTAAVRANTKATQAAAAASKVIEQGNLVSKAETTTIPQNPIATQAITNSGVSSAQPELVSQSVKNTKKKATKKKATKKKAKKKAKKKKATTKKSKKKSSKKPSKRAKTKKYKKKKKSKR